MMFINQYHSALGEILLAADENGLTGLWFYGQKYFARTLDPEHEEKNLPIFAEVRLWLDLYFSGTEPDFLVPLHLTGTDFSKDRMGEPASDSLWAYNRVF